MFEEQMRLFSAQSGQEKNLQGLVVGGVWFVLYAVIVCPFFAREALTMRIAGPRW